LYKHRKDYNLLKAKIKLIDEHRFQYYDIKYYSMYHKTPTLPYRIKIGKTERL